MNLFGASGTGSVLDFAGTNLTLSGILSFTQGSQAETVEVDGSSNTATLSGHLSDETGGAGPFTKTGLGTVIITQDNGYTSNGMNAAISFGSDTHINAGQIELTNGNGLGDGTFAHTITVASGAALELSGSITLPSGLTLDLTGSGINGTGALHTIGSSGFASTVASPVGLAAAGAVIGVDSSGTTTVTGLVSGTGQLTVGGSTTGLTKGTLILTDNSNSYSGGTLVNDGILQIQAADALGSTTADTTVADGAALQIQIAGTNTITQAQFKFLGTTFPATASGSLEEVPDPVAGSPGSFHDQNNTLAGAVVLPNPSGMETQVTISVDMPFDILTLSGAPSAAATASSRRAMPGLAAARWFSPMPRTPTAAAPPSAPELWRMGSPTLCRPRRRWSSRAAAFNSPPLNSTASTRQSAACPTAACPLTPCWTIQARPPRPSRTTTAARTPSAA